jgi:hypothetical protein
MSKQQAVEELINAAEVAKIWNRRAVAAGYAGNYSRWSVYQRRKKLGGVETPLGFLYSRKKAEEINLRFGSPARPEVAERNRKRKSKKQFSEDTETDAQNT